MMRHSTLQAGTLTSSTNARMACDGVGLLSGEQKRPLLAQYRLKTGADEQRRPRSGRQRRGDGDLRRQAEVTRQRVRELASSALSRSFWSSRER